MTDKLNNIQVAIVMAIYNPDLILFERQVQSILDQSHGNLRLFLIADGPQKNIAAIEKLAARDDRILLQVQPDNCGPTTTFLSGLSAAVADEQNQYFLYCDQDDIWKADKIAILLEEITAKGCSAVHSDAEVVDSDGRQLAPSLFASEGRKRDASLIDIFFCNNVTGMTMLFDRPVAHAAAQLAPGQHIEILHDHLTAMIAAAMNGISLVDQPLVQYVQHGENVVGYGISSGVRGYLGRGSFLRADSVSARYIDAVTKILPVIENAAVQANQANGEITKLHDMLLSSGFVSVLQLVKYGVFSSPRRAKIAARLAYIKLFGRGRDG